MRSARQVVHRSPHRSVGTIVAPWIEGGAFEHESETEKGFLQLAVTCPVVHGIRPQPFAMDLESGKERHTPDYLIQLKGGTKLVVEVKPERFIPKNETRFDRIAALLSERMLPYYVMSNCAPGNASVNEALLWRRYARSSVNDWSGEIALALSLASKSTETFESLQSHGVSRPVIYHLLGRGRLVSSTRFLLTPESRLHPFSVEEHLDERICFEHWIGCSPWRADLAP